MLVKEIMEEEVHTISPDFSVKKAAEALIKNGEVSDGLLNMVEMAFRAYDPCLACATHSLPGQTPLKIRIYNSDREVVRTIIRD